MPAIQALLRVLPCYGPGPSSSADNSWSWGPAPPSCGGFPRGPSPSSPPPGGAYGGGGSSGQSRQRPLRRCFKCGLTAHRGDGWCNVCGRTKPERSAQPKAGTGRPGPSKAPPPKPCDWSAAKTAASTDPKTELLLLVSASPTAKAAASANPQRGAPPLQAPAFGDGSEPYTWKRCSTRAKQGTPVPDLRPVVLCLWGGELDEARTLQCLLDLWSLWGGKFSPEECMQLPLL